MIIAISFRQVALICLVLHLARTDSLNAQTPDVIGGGVSVKVSVKTAPEFNRKVTNQLEKPIGMEKGKKSLARTTTLS